MLQITPQHRILLAVEPIDFRKGMDGLNARCIQKLFDDPFSGTVFCFTNRPRSSVKLLIYDATGFWLCHKRFRRGKLAWWPTGNITSIRLRASELMNLLAQVLFYCKATIDLSVLLFVESAQKRRQHQLQQMLMKKTSSLMLILHHL